MSTPGTASAATSPPAALPLPPPGAECSNCGTPLQGSYCHRCGQSTFDPRRPFFTLLRDLLETFLHLDGRVWRDLFALLFRPGRLTREYVQGRRARHVPPLRIYLFAAVLFFLWVELNPEGKSGMAIQFSDAEMAEIERQEELKGLSGVVRQSREDPEALDTRLRDYLPTAFLLLLPAVALLTRVLFVRRPPRYFEHLVLALHGGAFVYVFILAVAGWSEIFGLFAGPRVAEWVGTAGAIYLAVYFPLSFRVVFGDAWGWILVKSLVFVILALLMLAVGIGISALVALFLS